MSSTTTHRKHSAKLFPLRLCEVLENEFVTTRGPLAQAPTWLLRDGDIDFAVLGSCLQTSLQSSETTPLALVAAKLQRAGISIPAIGPWPENAADQIRDALNRLVSADENLYDHNLLDPDSEVWQLAELWQERSKRPTPSGSGAPHHGEEAQPDQDARRTRDEQIELNRLLLDAACPREGLASVDTSRLTRLFEAIRQLKGRDGTYSAICLSGGGIRSAAFALGVLQALARAGLLEKFDFLSTVSGGGYVGSWLSTWIHRHADGLNGVIKALGTRAQPEAATLRTKVDPTPAPIGFLRSYSHFLNPQAGLFTVDTWTWIGLYLRNLFLNWLVIIPLLLLVVALPRLYSALLYDWKAAHGDFFPELFWLATVATILTLVCVTVNRPSTSDPARAGLEPGATPRLRRLDRFMERFKHQLWLLALGVFPLFAFAVLLTLLVWGLPSSKIPLSLSQIVAFFRALTLPSAATVLAYIAYDHLVLWGEALIFISWIIAHALLPARDWAKRFEELSAMVLAGLLTWPLVANLARFAFRAGTSSNEISVLDLFTVYPAHLYGVFAVPTVVCTVLAGMTLFIGLVSKFRWIEDEDREWWARFGSWILVVTVSWSLLSAITIFGPPLLLQFPRVVAGIGGLSGLIAVLLGKSSLTSATGQKGSANTAGRKPVLDLFGANTVPVLGAVFLAVFLAFLSLLTSAALKPLLAWLSAAPAESDGSMLSMLHEWLAPASPFKDACGRGDGPAAWLEASVFHDAHSHLELTCQTPLNVVVGGILALGVFLGVASLLINLNKFSLHAAYRIRIVRTFLGASRASTRQPNAFTGFDPLDNVQMHELQPGLLREADIINLACFVKKLKDALASSTPTPERYLVEQMCSREHDPGGILRGRLASYDAARPVLRSLEQDVLQSLNRVLETARLDQVKAFQALLDGHEDATDKDTLERYVDHGNLIFANRLLIQIAFRDDIAKYAFPPPPPHKLIHVVNLTLNLVHGRRLAWQERKAAPFVVTPMHAGSYYLGYRESRNYGGNDGISIGTAVAISGAAVSPNMGYSSSPLTALLLTLFNVRLGWWLGNPGVAGTDTYVRAEPRFSLRPLLSEALGLTDDLSPYTYLSDGGHFENMGLFEMVLRRCQFIICTDAGADPDYQFADIGNAVRKIRIDFGIPIEFDSIPVHRQRGTEDDSGRYCYLGRIRYSYVDGAGTPDGILICFKPVLRGNEPRDVANYAAQNAAFPQESTVDQFFGESQFESYRQLGEFAVETVFGSEPPPASVSWARWATERTSLHLGMSSEQPAWLGEWLGKLPGAEHKGTA